jgi:hypothetical protein
MPRKKTRVTEEIADYSTCWFCGKRAPDVMASLLVGIHQEIARESVDQGTRIRYRSNGIAVPRCKKCQRAHTIDSIIMGFSFVLVILGTITLSLLRGWSAGWQIVVEILCAIAIGAILYAILHWLFMPKGVKDKDDAKEFPELKSWLNQGWKIGKKPES